MDFLERLDLTPSEKRQLASLGITSSVALAHMVRASETAFHQFIGDRERSERVHRQLREILSPAERDSLDQPGPPAFSLGARLDKPPKSGT
jgi:hypothetical protein